MASFFKKTMLYLGLGPDEDYEVYDEAPEAERARPERETTERGRPERREAREPANGGRGGAARGATGQDHASAVRPLRPSPTAPPTEEQPERGEARAARSGSMAGSVVRPLPRLSNARPHPLAPASFNDVQEVADRFKSSHPVIVNLEGADRDLRRRLIDFCSGLCYGLSGQMERVADNVYLLTPSNVEVSPEDRRRLERGLEE